MGYKAKPALVVRCRSLTNNRNLQSFKVARMLLFLLPISLQGFAPGINLFTRSEPVSANIIDTFFSMKSAETDAGSPIRELSNAKIQAHHTAIRTGDIENAMKFYSLLGFEVEAKFRAGPARAAWLSCDMTGFSKDGSRCMARLELIEVPSYMLHEEKQKNRAIDLLQKETLLGLNHVAFDVTELIRYEQTLQENPEVIYSLQDWLDKVDIKSQERFGKSLRVALPPWLQNIGRDIYEMAFLYDADGSLVELLRWTKTLDQDMESGWEPWDGKDFLL